MQQGTDMYKETNENEQKIKKEMNAARWTDGVCVCVLLLDPVFFNFCPLLYSRSILCRDGGCPL